MADGDDERITSGGDSAASASDTPDGTSTSSSEGADDSSASTPNSAEDRQPPQPDALREQQRYVAVGGSVVAGLAVTVSLVQRYPGFAPVWLLAGLLSGFAVYRLAAGSVFPGEDDASGTDRTGDDPDSDSSE